ncbi:MAG TPA: KTSC domain-containing protein [Fimbriimonas sp.]|nr:KTSC domain-containing protein [Fimbriimonas sp.]
MKHEPVSSSILRSVGYDERLGILEVEFYNGSLYRYAAVPPHVHEALMSAPSKGAFMNTRIRDQYLTVKVR